MTTVEKESKWDLKSACECLIRNGGKADPFKKRMSHPRPGIRLLGIMDYLAGVHKFIRTAGDEKPTRKREVKKPEREVIVTYK